MINPSGTFYILLRNYNGLSEIVSPQLKQIFSSYGSNVLDGFKAHYEALNSNNPTKNLAIFFAKLDGQLKNISDPGIVAGWRAYFKSRPDKIKSEFYKLVPNPKFLGVNMPSGNVVSFGNIMSGPVTPNVNLPGNKAPINLINMGVKVPSYIMSNVVAASTMLGKLYNKNITGVMDSISVSTKSHGSNLVPDSKHVERMGKVVQPFYKKIIGGLGDAGNYFLKNMNFNPFGVQNSDISSPNMVVQQSVGQTSSLLNAAGQDISKKYAGTVKDFASPKPSSLV